MPGVWGVAKPFETVSFEADSDALLASVGGLKKRSSVKNSMKKAGTSCFVPVTGCAIDKEKVTQLLRTYVW